MNIHNTHNIRPPNGRRCSSYSCARSPLARGPGGEEEEEEEGEEEEEDEEEEVAPRILSQHVDALP